MNIVLENQETEINNNVEIWKDIPGYEGYYQISNLGRIKSIEREIRNFHKNKEKKYYASLEQMLQLLDEGKSQEEVAEILGLTLPGLKARLKKIHKGIAKKPRKKRSQQTFIKKNVISTGYYSINLYKDGTVKHCNIHRLLAEAFIPNPENKPHINHKDGNKLNNNLNNLEWCTHYENMVHAFETGLAGKLNKAKVLEIIKLHSEGIAIQELAIKFNVCKRTVSDVIHRHRWQYAFM